MVVYIHQSQLFSAALFTIAKTWEQPKHPMTSEWIKNVYYIYTMDYYSATKTNGIRLFVEMEDLLFNCFAFFIIHSVYL